MIYVAVQNDREWWRFCELVLVSPKLAEDSRFGTNAARVENREDLFEIVDAAFLGMTTEEALERLNEADIAHAQVNSVLDFVRHPQLGARDRWREVDSPVGSLLTLLPPANVEGLETVLRAVPDVGEHTDKVLAELGYAPDVIERLREEGVV
jgi:itaconate CoA-transferase